MKHIKPLAITCAAFWIVTFEFVRNQLLFLSYWTDHYKSLGLTFATKPINGAVWMLWSFVFASLLYAIRRHYSVKHTVILGWMAGFVMMWLVIGNLGVLPTKLLVFAVPLSIVEVYVATWIIDNVGSK